MIVELQTGSPRIVAFKLSGKLHDEDYRRFIPAVESVLRVESRIRMLAQFEDFHGWDLHAAWDDFKFGMAHASDIERLALVGDRSWERWMARFCRPFMRAEVRYFDAADLNAAWEWVREAG